MQEIIVKSHEVCKYNQEALSIRTQLLCLTQFALGCEYPGFLCDGIFASLYVFVLISFLVSQLFLDYLHQIS